MVWLESIVHEAPESEYQPKAPSPRRKAQQGFKAGKSNEPCLILFPVANRGLLSSAKS